MKTLFAAVCLGLLGTTSSGAQDYAPPNAKTPDKVTLDAIGEKTRRLGQALVIMQRQGIHDPVLADVEIYYKAAEWIVRHNEFFTEQSGVWTLSVLDRGMLRATQALRGEAPWLPQTGQAVLRAYRSRIDGSVQPYAVTIPPEYGKDPRLKWRIDVVLHGRDSGICEVKFLYQHSGDRAAAAHPYIQIDIFGRGNNAYRWAGEVDVLEAIDHFVANERMLNRADLLDASRVVLRGFSMGGAGTWHLGLHRPDRWCVIGPGAGFTTTRGYVKDKALPEPLPAYIENCLHIYDAVEYAPNVFNVPVVAYAGESDPQLQAARNIEARLHALKIPMTLLVAPGLKHEFPAEWQNKAESEYANFAGPGKGRPEQRDSVRFTTYTLKYPGCDWVELLGLERHYQRSQVEAQRKDDEYLVKTLNIRALRLGLPPGDASPHAVKIDDQELNVRPGPGGAGQSLFLEKREGRWHGVMPQVLFTDRVRRLQKLSGLQGPIDDAFMDTFLCVRGSGTAWNAAVQKYADADLERFQREWDKYFRGELPVKNDNEVTDEDIAGKHLILFGDPGSNRIMAQVLDRLPLKWSRETVSLGGKTFSAADHVPAVIYPSPLNSNRYVVLNSGHTFHAEDFQGTNALLFPRLGDYAVLKVASPGKDPLAIGVATAGLFDDNWKISEP
jgi:predicted esterase